jgi:hypothetical protein
MVSASSENQDVNGFYLQGCDEVGILQNDYKLPDIYLITAQFLSGVISMKSNFSFIDRN